MSGAGLALLSALLFGAATPLAKLLLGSIDPWLLAGLLYLGSGLGLGGFLLARRGVRTEASLSATDLPWLGLVILSGGIAAPVLLMVGLALVPASSAALLLNLEAVATLGMAWLAFGETADRRILLGAVAILGGAILLSWPDQAGSLGWGSAAIVLACLAWALDNNLTRKLSSADPVQITAIKGLVAGLVNLVIALARGAAMPDLGLITAAGLIGLAGYGVSLVLYVRALRDLGAARTGAYFATAPFVGAVIALMLAGQAPSLALLVAGALMALGVYLHLAEDHGHDHLHEPMTHEHRHRHDAHHRHAHEPDTPPGVVHSHRHCHAPLRHRHAHYPDEHHRHRHG